MCCARLAAVRRVRAAGLGDLSGYGEAGIHHPRFHVLRLRPYRIQILRGEQFAAADFTPRTWRRDE